MENSKAIEALNDLSARTYDAEAGYKEAAENVKNPRLKSLCNEYAQQRYDFGHEIKDCVTKLGGTPQKGGTIEGKAHQIWMDVKTAFSSNDDATVLKEINRGEETTIKAYDEALENIQIGTPTYDKIVAQRNQVRSIFNRTQNLESIFENA